MKTTAISLKATMGDKFYSWHELLGPLPLT